MHNPKVLLSTSGLKSYQKAMDSDESHLWNMAINSEIAALIHNETWEEVPLYSLPAEHSIHRPIWHFKIKADGRYKAHLCFDGRHQILDLDYFDTYSPVTRFETICILLSFAMTFGYLIRLGDIPNAFLNSDVDANVFMHYPDVVTARPGYVL